MERAKSVVESYAICNELKDVIRTGWKDWRVQRERLESVAEHIYGVQMLAIIVNSQYQCNIDLEKVVLMLAIHELEEIYIGDLTLFQISKEEKAKLGHEAVSKLLEGWKDKEKIENLILEFDEGKTKEAKFAFFCDKMECDLQSKLYDEEDCVDLNNQEGNKTYHDAKVQKLLQQEKSWSGMWLQFGQERYNYDEIFLEISNYAKNNKIKKLTKTRN